MTAVDPAYLRSTLIIDSDHPAVAAFARGAAGGSTDPIDMAVRLYYAVRDGILYDPYSPFYLPEHYRASRIIEKGRGYCVLKIDAKCAARVEVGVKAIFPRGLEILGRQLLLILVLEPGVRHRAVAEIFVCRRSAVDHCRNAVLAPPGQNPVMIFALRTG